MAPTNLNDATIVTGDTITLDADSPITALTVQTGAILACGTKVLTPTGAVSITGTVSFTTGGFTNNGGAITVNAGGIYGSNTAWVFTQKQSLRIDGTFNAPNASGTWTWDGTGTHINGSGTFNHDGGTLTITAGATGLGGYAAIGNGNPSWTWNNIVNSSGTATGWQAGVVGVDGTLTANTTSSFIVDNSLRATTLTLGTTSASGLITGAGVFQPGAIGAGLVTAVVIKAASSAFPWTCNTTTVTTNTSSGYAVTFQDGLFTENITTGANAANIYTINSMTFSGTLTVSAGDTWKSISSTYQGAITATGTFWSVNHNRTNGLCVYGGNTRQKFSTINDAQYLPKNGGAIYVLAGCELYVDRGQFNETVTPTSAPVYRYVLSDAAHHPNANLYFADGIQVRLPKGWNRTATGVLGGSRKNVAFRCVFGYGFEGETAGANPALGTTTEGAGGGAIDISASNPDTGLNSLDVNQPAAASGITIWDSAAFQVTVTSRCIARVSVYIDSSMAGASVIEEMNLGIDDDEDASGTCVAQQAFRYDSGNTRYSLMNYNGAAWVDLATRKAYAASTRYELVQMFNLATGKSLVAVDGVIYDVAASNRQTGRDGIYYRILSAAATDGRVRVDNLIVCNLDTDTPAKAMSGAWADLENTSVVNPVENPTANYRISVIDVPAGVIA